MRFWYVAILCACGSSSEAPDAGVDGRGGGGPDAMSDAMIDAGPDCSGAGAVTVRGLALEPGSDLTLELAVASHDAKGLLCNVATGGSGSDAQMTIDAPPGGMVSMIIDALPDGGRHIFTWTEVQPGDTLLFPSPTRRVAGLQTVQIEMSIPAVTGGSNYDVILQCEHGGGTSVNAAPGAFTTSLDCGSDSQHVAALVRADVGANEQFAVAPITAIAATDATTLPLDAWMPAATPSATVHGATGFEYAFAGFVPSPTADYGSTSFLAYKSPVGDPVVVGPRGVPPTWMLGVSVGLSSETPPHTLQLGRMQTTPASLDLTRATDFLPDVTAQLVTGLPRPAVSWSLAGTATADAVYINAGGWLIITRPQPGTVRFPELLQNLLPTDAAKLEAVNFIDAATVAGFDDVRRDPAQAYMSREYSLSSVGDVFSGVVP